MKPLLCVVAICLLSLSALADKETPKDLSDSKEPIIEAEDGDDQKRTERCSTCTAKLNIKSPNEVLAAIQALPGAEVHTQQSFENCSSEKGCAGIKVKDGRVVERFGNTDAFRAAAAADTGNEFSFHAAGSFGNNVFEGGLPGQGPFWWMNQDSPFKNGGGNFEKFEKSSSSFSSTGSGAGADLGGNAFLGFGAGAAQAAKPGASFQSSSFESSSFSTSKNGEVDISKNPFLNGGIKFGQAGFQAQGGFGAAGQGASQFGGQGAGFGASQAGQSSQNKYSGSSNTAFSAGSSQGFGAQGNQGFGNQAAQANAQGFGAQGSFSSGSFQGAQASKFGAGNAGSAGSAGNSGAFGNSAFAANNAANKFSAGFSGSSPRPFQASTAAGSNVNLIQNSQKSEFDYEQQQQVQNIDEAFQSTGNVNSQVIHSGGELQQTCAGQGYVCVHKAQCNNGVVNTNGQSILQAKTSKQYCNVKTEICCRIELSNLAGAAGQDSLGVGLATFQGQGGLFAQAGQNGQGSSSFGSSQSGAGQAGSAGSAGSSQTGQNAFGSSSSSFESSSFNANRQNSFGAGGQNGGSFGASGQNGGSFGASGQAGQAGQNSFGSNSATNQFGATGQSSFGSSTNKFGSTTGQFGSSGVNTAFGSNAGSVNRGSTASGFESQGSFGSTNKATGNGFSTATPNRFGSTNEVFKTTSQSNFIETDSFSSGSEAAGVFRPGASGSGLKPGIPYLPPVDSSTQASVLVTSTARPRPTTVKPTYLPPLPSTNAPTYLPPDQYEDGSLLLDVTRVTPRPTVPQTLNNDIPAGCAAALKCTPIEYCTAEGVISNSTVILSRDQEAFRVPLTDCKDLDTGRIGKCCRDPNYTDPWPTNLIGKWVDGVFGGNDGKYNPTNDRQVTARPPVTGGITQTFSRETKPTVSPFGPNQVTPGFPGSTNKYQGQFGVASSSQVGVGGRGQVEANRQGQFGFGTQQTQGSQISTATAQFNQNQNRKTGQAVLTGQGEGVAFGQGQGISQGQGFIGQEGGLRNEFASQNRKTEQTVISGQGQGQFGQAQGQFGQGLGFGIGVGFTGQGGLAPLGGGQKHSEVIVSQSRKTEVISGGKGGFGANGAAFGGQAFGGQNQGFGARGGEAFGSGGGQRTSEFGARESSFSSRGSEVSASREGAFGGRGSEAFGGRGSDASFARGSESFGARGSEASVTRGNEAFGSARGSESFGSIRGSEAFGSARGSESFGSGRGSEAFGAARGTEAFGARGSTEAFGARGIEASINRGSESFGSARGSESFGAARGNEAFGSRSDGFGARGSEASLARGSEAFGGARGGETFGARGTEASLRGVSEFSGGETIVEREFSSSQSSQVNSFQQAGGQNNQIQAQGQSQGQGQGQKAGFGQGLVTGVGQGVIQGGGSIVSQGSRYDVESQNQYSENIYRVFLSQYAAGGQCGVLNPQNPYGNRNELEVDFAEIPWQAMVLLQTNRSLLCGGVITRPDVVVTSAACVEGLNAGQLKVKGGEWKLGIDDEPLPFQIVGVKHILRHPFYKRGSLEYDAAILVLDENLRLANNIYPICLPGVRDTVDAFYNGAGECIVTGWGKQVLQAHLAGSIMHSVNVSLINPGECQAKLSQDYPHLLEQYNQDSCVCGQPTNPTNNICRVDIGSALACSTGNGHFVLRGVYSWDSGCQLGNQLAAFYKFDLEWYEWATGLIESARFAQFANGQANRFSGQLNSAIKGSSSGVKGSFGSGQFNKFSSGQAILSSSLAGGQSGQVAGSGQLAGAAQLAGSGQAKGQFSGSQGFTSGQYSQFGASKFGTSGSGVSFQSAPITNSFSASYTERKVIKSEPQIITYTTKPEIVTFTTPPKYFTYTTKPQVITYETSGSDTNSRYAVAPNVSFNPSFTDAVKGHTHNAQCKCLENGKK